MPVVEQLSVSLAKKGADRLLGSAIEIPETGGTSESYAIRVGGWVLGRDARIEAVQAARPGHVLQTVPVELVRPDVADRFPQAKEAERCGFGMFVDTLVLEPVFEIRLRAVLPDQARIPLAVIRGRRRPLRPAFEPTRQPLIVTSLARSGTTLLMRLLAEHPRIVAYRRHPYEVRAARYWLHALRVLAGPADSGTRIGHPNRFDQDKLAVGGNPFYSATFPAYPPVEAWSGSVYVDRLTEFFLHSIDDWYGCVATSQGQSAAAYFAEKHFPDEYPRLIWELYPRAREIVLVRDFRDMASSMLAYNARKGIADFGRDRASSDAEWIERLGRGAAELFESWRSRANRAYLVRYENLVASPHETLRPLLAYLDLDASPGVVDAVIERALQDTPELRRHPTSANPAASIGRWRRDLEPSLQVAARAAFDDVLARFGYDPQA